MNYFLPFKYKNSLKANIVKEIYDYEGKNKDNS